MIEPKRVLRALAEHWALLEPLCEHFDQGTLSLGELRAQLAAQQLDSTPQDITSLLDVWIRLDILVPVAKSPNRFELNAQIHDFLAEDVIDAKGWSAQLHDITAFVGEDVLVAHNAGFDMAVLRRACEATGDPCPPYRSVCSLQVARKLYELDLGSAVLGVDDLVADCDVERDAVAVVVDAAGAYCNNFTLLGLLLGSVRNDKT